MSVHEEFFDQLVGTDPERDVYPTCQNTTLTSPNELFQYGSIPAIGFIIIVSFLTVRVREFCCKCCLRRPSIAIPMNFISQRQNKLLYLAAFGLSSYIAVNIVQTPYPFDFLGKIKIEPWIGIFLKILGVFVYGITFYPLLACIYHNSIASLILGTIYVATLLSVNIHNIAVCAPVLKLNAKQWTILWFKFFPMFIFCVSLIVCFIMKIVKLIKRKTQLFTSNCSKSIKNSKTYIYNLLQKPVNKKYEQMTSVERIKDYIGLNAFFYPGVTFSTFFLCSILTSCFVLYELMYNFIVVLLLFEERMMKQKEQIKNDTRSMDVVINDTINAVHFMMNFDGSKTSQITALHNVMSNFSATKYRLMVHIFDLLKICWMISLIVATAINVFHLPFILINYKFNMLEIYKGRYSQLSRRHYVGSNAGLVLGYSRFAGYQVAFFAWGYTVQILAYFLVSGVVCFVFYVPIRYGFGQFWITLIKKHWPIAIAAIVLTVAQMLVSRFAFSQDRGATLGLTRRNMYFVWVYFMFFYNIFLGIVSAVLRIGKGALFGLLFMSRIDHAVIAKKFEFQDTGWMSYQSFLHIQNLHTNPILLFFLNILEENKVHDTKRKHYESVKFKWALYYTLIRNPSLISQRKQFLENLKAKYKNNDTKKEKEELNNSEDIQLNDFANGITNDDSTQVTIVNFEKKNEELLTKVHINS